MNSRQVSAYLNTLGASVALTPGVTAAEQMAVVPGYQSTSNSEEEVLPPRCGVGPCNLCKISDPKQDSSQEASAFTRLSLE